MPFQGIPGTTATVPVPTIMNGVQAGDLLLAFVYVCWDADFATSSEISTPAGWTLVDQDSVVYSDPAQGDRLAVYSRISGGVEPADYAFTWLETAAWIGRIVAFRNADPGTPLTPAGAMVVSADSDPISTDAPSVVTTVVDQQILCVWAARDGTSWTLPVGMEALSQTVGGVDGVAGVVPDLASGNPIAQGTMNIALETIAAPGPTGVRTATAQPGLAPPDGVGIAFTIALNPAP
jgi:hypothetical protein